MIRFSIAVLMMLASKSQAQIVCLTTNRSEADKKIFVTQNRSEADILVYETTNKREAKPYSGIWYFTKTRSEADWKIIFTEVRSEADFKVCFVKMKAEAKFNK